MEQIKQKIEEFVNYLGYYDREIDEREEMKSELMDLLVIATEESFVAGMLFESSSVERPDFTTWWNQFKEEMK